MLAKEGGLEADPRLSEGGDCETRHPNDQEKAPAPERVVPLMGDGEFLFTCKG